MKSPIARAAVVSAAFVALVAASDAFAVLGGAPTYPANASNAQVVQRAAAAASAASGAAAASYSVQQTTLDTGTVVREYVSGGTVFGIAWEGPQMPDLRTLLGTYFPQYVGAIDSQRSAVGGRRPVFVNQGGLVVRSGGHMGDFSGHAFLPQSLPAGVTESDIR
jgi:Protein of unknown function (DUF2844)